MASAFLIFPLLVDVFCTFPPSVGRGIDASEPSATTEAPNGTYPNGDTGNGGGSDTLAAAAATAATTGSFDGGNKAPQQQHSLDGIDEESAYSRDVSEGVLLITEPPMTPLNPLRYHRIPQTRSRLTLAT